MTKPIPRIIAGIRREEIRVTAEQRDGRPVVQLRLMEPLTPTSATMTVVGRGLMVPVERVAELMEALYAAKAEALPAEAFEREACAKGGI